MAPVLERKSIGSDQTNGAKRRAPDLIWRTKNQARDQVYTPNQGFNLLQISPNWFLRNWTLDPRLKWA
jgi:hypothetical protein